MLGLEQLREYRFWVGQSASDVQLAALSCGGWTTIFANALPVWASRVRNYFNETPRSLTLLKPTEAEAFLVAVNRYLGLKPNVYRDESNRYWYQAISAATKYHYRGGNLLTAALGSPVFKLLCIDSAGGSSEVCIKNLHSAGSIGAPGQSTDVSSLVVRDNLYQGTYNYADSAVRGYPAHEALDMIPQGKHPNFYLPVMPELPLSSRRFPAPGAFSTLSG